MSGASRILTILTATSPLLLRRCRLLHRPSLSFRRRLIRYRPTQISSSPAQIHSQAVPINSSSNSISSTAHPWPEWCNLINEIFAGGVEEERGVRSDDDDFVAYEQLNDDFVRAANACLQFARQRPELLGSLSRRDIEVVVSNGTPFLFRNALETARRMRAFIGIDGNHALDHGEAQTIDIMKYILSYASNPAGSPGRHTLYSRELLETSIRNLLHELVEVSWGNPAPSSVFPPPGPYQFSGSSGQTPRPTGQNIVMKRGDWICPKCDFMNFARNTNCLECHEPRPRRQLTGGEWECPKCDFFNYGRNMVCLRCDCKRPSEASFNTANSSSGNGYKSEIDRRLAENEEKAQRWFSKINDASGLNNNEADEDFPEIMPLRKGENKFVMSTRKTPLERRLTNSQYKVNSVNNGFPRDTDKTIDSSLSQSIDQILGDSPSTSNKIANEQNAETVENMQLRQTDDQYKEQEQAEKSERWFRKMTELHDAKDVPSAIPEDDFPEIMPMRKGENRFVISKKKDRSLTSLTYKRQAAMEQPTKKDFVPFVPFPPGYFATKETRSPDESVSPETQSNDAKSQSRPIDTPEDSSAPLQENQNRGGWTGKSLEGSGVKEPDPLDMSEEAKTERWFKRVAQIKDISELSQIPDEDFPSIMPMRKGVNRFVVSKRKTPLERRLNSSQYKSNIPAVRKENDDNETK